MNEPRRLATYVQPTVSESRIQAQWLRIAEQSIEKPLQRGWWYAAGAVAAVMLILISVLYGGRSPERGGTQLVVERMASGLQKVTFPEEISVTLQSEASYSVLERSSGVVHLQLERGAAEFDVTPGRARRVIVTAAGFDVEVVGTRFELILRDAIDRQDLEVRVLRGSVKVRSTGTVQPDIRTLTAGQTWSTRTVASPLVREHAEPEPSSTQSAAPVSSTSSARGPSAKELFDIAEAHRLKGNVREAAAALDRLRRGYPSDPRAGLAAFELGRLRMDQLGDATGALNALADATRLEPSARFRQDAEARMVQLYHRLGQTERCRMLRTEYLKRYPNSPHTSVVKSQCVP